MIEFASILGGIGKLMLVLIGIGVLAGLLMASIFRGK